METKYQQKLRTELKEQNELAESTINNIMSQLKKINGDKKFNSLSFLKNQEEVVNFLNLLKIGTRKTYLSSIKSSLEHLKTNRTYKKHYTFFKELLDKTIKDEAEEKQSKKSKKEQDNWIDWADVLKIKDELHDKVKDLKIKKLNKNQYNNLLKYFVLSLYTCIEPRRNRDFLEMVINRVSDRKGGLTDEKNHLVLNEHKFIFNKYKTAKTHKQQTIDFSDNDEMKEAIDLYIKYHPIYRKNKKNILLLVDYSGKPLTSVNSITRILNKIFKKNIGSSMLRKVYITSKFGDDIEKFNEMKKTAKNMGHSVLTQQTTYNKGDNDTL